MNIKTNVKGSLLSDLYVNISVDNILNYLASNNSVYGTINICVEVSQTEIKFTQIFFDHSISKKSILVGDSKNIKDLPNVIAVAHIKDTQLIYGG